MEKCVLAVLPLSLPPGGAAKRKQSPEKPRENEELAFPWLQFYDVCYNRKETHDFWDTFRITYPPKYIIYPEKLDSCDGTYLTFLYT